MKKRIATILAAMAIISSLGSSAVMARGPICPCLITTARTEETVTGIDIYGHTIRTTTYEECVDCGNVVSVSSNESWSYHDLITDHIDSYVETDETGITSTKYTEYRICSDCGYTDTVKWEVIH